MALAFNNDHIIDYHMDALQSVDLAQTYFTDPDYLVFQCWVFTVYLSSDTVNQVEPQAYHYVTFFLGGWATCPLETHITTLWL